MAVGPAVQLLADLCHCLPHPPVSARVSTTASPSVRFSRSCRTFKPARSAAVCSSPSSPDPAAAAAAFFCRLLDRPVPAAAAVAPSAAAFGLTLAAHAARSSTSSPVAPRVLVALSSASRLRLAERLQSRSPAQAQTHAPAQAQVNRRCQPDAGSWTSTQVVPACLSDVFGASWFCMEQVHAKGGVGDVSRLCIMQNEGR